VIPPPLPVGLAEVAKFTVSVLRFPGDFVTPLSHWLLVHLGPRGDGGPGNGVSLMLKTEKERLSVHIRWMIRRDMPEVLAIEAHSFEFPWTDDDFLRCLRQRNCIGMVAEQGDRVVGFMIYELHRSRLHILNFAVHPQFRRHGVGEQMVSKLVAKLSSQRRNRIMLEVRETNLPAQLFFRSLGFKAISLLREFYEDTPEDAYLMQYRLASSAAAEDEPIRKAG
jgi:ribosomal-protein-alanine N-acetyltransferase